MSNDRKFDLNMDYEGVSDEDDSIGGSGSEHTLFGIADDENTGGSSNSDNEIVE